VDLNTTAVVLHVAADALSFTVAASKAMPYINATAISFDEPAACVCERPPLLMNPNSATIMSPMSVR
jgi:hypothetical protein